VPAFVKVSVTSVEHGIEVLRTLAVLDGDYEGMALHAWREDTGIKTLDTADKVDALADLLDPHHAEADSQSALRRTLSRAAGIMRRPNSVVWSGGKVASAETVRIILG